MIANVKVKLGARSHDVRIGAGLVDGAGREIVPLLARPRIAVVTDNTVAGLHLGRLQAALSAEGRRTRCAGPAAGRGNEILGRA